MFLFLRNRAENFCLQLFWTNWDSIACLFFSTQLKRPFHVDFSSFPYLIHINNKKIALIRCLMLIMVKNHLHSVLVNIFWWIYKQKSLSIYVDLQIVSNCQESTVCQYDYCVMSIIFAVSPCSFLSICNAECKHRMRAIEMIPNKSFKFRSVCFFCRSLLYKYREISIQCFE